jgi:hypothetical protein
MCHPYARPPDRHAKMCTRLVKTCTKRFRGNVLDLVLRPIVSARLSCAGLRTRFDRSGHISVKNLIGLTGGIDLVVYLLVALTTLSRLGSWQGLCGRFAGVYGGYQVGREVWSARYFASARFGLPGARDDHAEHSCPRLSCPK